jgi:mevalonate kinase
VDSGTPARTGETVAYVKELKEKNPDKVNSVMNNLDEISRASLEVIKSYDLRTIGNLMVEYYNELKTLDLSTSKLDEIVNIALNNDAYAKPTGGWGGGCCIVLSEDQKYIEKLANIYREKNYKAFQTKLGVDGVGIKFS